MKKKNTKYKRNLVPSCAFLTSNKHTFSLKWLFLSFKFKNSRREIHLKKYKYMENTFRKKQFVGTIFSHFGTKRLDERRRNMVQTTFSVYSIFQFARVFCRMTPSRFSAGTPRLPQIRNVRTYEYYSPLQPPWGSLRNFLESQNISPNKFIQLASS